MTPGAGLYRSCLTALVACQAQAAVALPWGAVEPSPEPPAPPSQWRDSPTASPASPGWNLLNPADSQSPGLPPWQLVPANEVIDPPTNSGAAPPLLSVAEVQDLLANQLPSRDDYLPLLPEALPFLGELLEDGDEGVARRARALVADLEKAAGESLEPYLKA